MTEEEKQIVVEALLFASSVQVCANWTPERQAKMIDIAKELGAQPSGEIEFWKDDYEEDEPWASRIPEEFQIKITSAADETEFDNYKEIGGE